MGEDVTKLVEGSRLALSTGLSLATDPVRALGAGGIQNAGNDFGADAGFQVGAGDGAGEGGAGQAVDEVLADVGGEAVEGVPVYRDERA